MQNEQIIPSHSSTHNTSSLSLSVLFNRLLPASNTILARLYNASTLRVKAG